MRNFILAAALFLTAGIASAAVTHEDWYSEDDNHEFLGQEVAYNLSDLYIYHNFEPEDTPYYLLRNVGLITSADFPYTVTLFRENMRSSPWSQDLIANTWQDVYVINDDPYYSSDLVLKVGGLTSGYLYTEGNPSLGYFTQSGNSIVFKDSNGNTATVTFGTPLPTPVITLLIALGFGAAFVMYRNRKQVNA